MTRETDREQQRLRALRDLRILDTPPEPRYDDLVELASLICETPMALISFVDQERQWIKARIGLSAEQGPREESVCQHAIMAGEEVFVVEDTRLDPRFRGLPLVLGPPHMRFYAGAPLATPDGNLGTLCVLDNRPRGLRAAQRSALAALSRQVVHQLELGRIGRRDALYREIFEAAEIGIWVWRADSLAHEPAFRLLSINAAAARMVGVERDDVVGRSIEEIAPFLAPTERSLWMEVLGRKGPSRGRRSVSGRELDVRAFPIDETTVVSVFEDVTARADTERLKSEFVSTVSHELRTPLTSIRGTLGLLEGGVLGELPSEAIDLIRIARTETERLVRLINDILDLDKMDAGRVEMKLEAILVEPVLRGAVGALQSTALLEDVSITIDVEPGLLAISEKDPLTQIAVNLVGNAIKFSPRGCGVIVRALRARDKVRIEVIDRGPGIAPELRRKLFTRFLQLDQSDARQKPGTGLGLAIVKALAEAMGGKVGLESEISVGSTFWVELPGVTKVSRTTGSLRAPRGRTVLVACSDALERRAIAEALFAHEYIAPEAETIERAVECAQLSPIDVAVIDLDELQTEELAHVLPGAVPLIRVRRSPQEDGVAARRPVLRSLDSPVDSEALLVTLNFALAIGKKRVLIVDSDASFGAVVRRQLMGLGVASMEVKGSLEALSACRALTPDLIISDATFVGAEPDAAWLVAALQASGIAPKLLIYSAADILPEHRGRLELRGTCYLTKSRTSDASFLATVEALLSS